LWRPPLCLENLTKPTKVLPPPLTLPQQVFGGPSRGASESVWTHPRTHQFFGGPIRAPISFLADPSAHPSENVGGPIAHPSENVGGKVSRCLKTFGGKFWREGLAASKRFFAGSFGGKFLAGSLAASKSLAGSLGESFTQSQKVLAGSSTQPQKVWREVWVKVSRSLKKFDESLGESFTKVWVKVSRNFG